MLKHECKQSLMQGLKMVRIEKINPIEETEETIWKLYKTVDDTESYDCNRQYDIYICEITHCPCCGEKLEVEKPKKVDMEELYQDTLEFEWIWALRSIGVNLTYKQTEKFMLDCISKWAKTKGKHPYDYTEEEIIDAYNKYYRG